jgi:hypothetical protein
MLMLKACPRCHGDLVLEYSPAADYYECLQCGHVLSTAQEHLLGIDVVHGHEPASPPRLTPRPARIGTRSRVRCRAAPLTPAALALRRAFRPAYLP